MKKSGGVIFILFFVISIASILLYSYFVFFFDGETDEVVLFAPPAFSFPNNCSDNIAIRALWDQIFIESSANIILVTQTNRSDVCEYIYAWKQTGGFTYVMALHVQSTNFSGNPLLASRSTSAHFIWGNFTSNVNSSFLTLTSSSVGVGGGISLASSLLFSSYSYALSWSGPVIPDEAFSRVFSYANETPFVTNGSYYSFVYEEEFTTSSNNSNISYDYVRSTEGVVHLSNQTSAYLWVELFESSCTSLWTYSAWGACNGTVQNRSVWDQKNCGSSYGMPNTTQACVVECISNWVSVPATACNASEIFVVWYNDTNLCANATVPANTTGYCDYDNNNVIGRLEHVVDENLNIGAITVDGSNMNYSRNYTGEGFVTFVEEGSEDIVRLAFDYNFDDEPLNLMTVRIEKQDNDSNFGYLIVDGLDVIDKDFRVDRIYGSYSLCVRDDETIDNISDIDDDCDDDDEYFLECPGVEGEFNCSDGGDTTYLVRGLDHSGVRELDYQIPSSASPPPSSSSSGSCTPLWDCGLWGQCSAGVERRVCIDYSGCPNVTTSYNETRACNATCVSVWNCGAWEPESCSEGQEQTQICTDENGCSSAQTRTRNCFRETLSSNSDFSWTFIVFIVGIGIAAVGVLVFLIILTRRNTHEDRSDSSFFLNKPPAGSFTPTHYGGLGGYNGREKI